MDMHQSLRQELQASLSRNIKLKCLVRRSGLEEGVCEQCGKEILYDPDKDEFPFCSDCQKTIDHGRREVLLEVLKNAITRGGFELGSCKCCGMPVLYLNEGLAPVCDKCLEE